MNIPSYFSPPEGIENITVFTILFTITYFLVYEIYKLAIIFRDLMSRLGLILFLITILVACNEEQYLGRVHITQENGRFTLIRNGEPFYIRGANGTVQLGELSRIGGNTIRTYDTLDLENILNDAHANGLAVIVGLPMIRSYHYNTYYANDSLVRHQYEAFRNTIRKYRDHPALLMWCLGNELNFSFGPKYRHFYDALNDMIDMVHSEDPDHPVTTTIQSFGEKYVANIKWYAPDFDVISINTFSKLRSLQEDLSVYEWFWDGPYILTEWGVNGHWESDSTRWGVPIEEPSGKKAEFIAELYSEYIQPENKRCLGSLAFYWGSRQEKTDTWYPLITDEGEETQMVDVLEELWTGRSPENHAPQVNYLHVNKKSPRDNALLISGHKYAAEVNVADQDGDSLRYHWYVYAENWFKPTFDSEKPVVPIISSISGAPVFEFRAPALTGAYRLAVKVNDGHKKFGTANVPFYVVN